MIAVMTGRDLPGRPLLRSRPEGPADPGHRPRPLRGRAGRRRCRGARDRRRGHHPHRRRVRRASAVITIDAALAPMPRISTTSSTCGRVSSMAWARSTSNRAMSVTTTRSRAETSRRRSPGRISSSKASTLSRRSTSTRWNRTRRSPSGWAMTISPSGRPASTRFWSARSWPISTPFPLPRSGRGALSRRRFRQQVVHQDGADHLGLARKTGRPVRIANSVDESMVTTRRHGMSLAADRRHERWPAPRPRGPRLVRHRRLCRQRTPRRRHRRRRRPGRIAGKRCRLTPGASTPTPHLPVPTAPSEPATCNGAASCRSTRSPAAAD